MRAINAARPAARPRCRAAAGLRWHRVTGNGLAGCTCPCVCLFSVSGPHPTRLHACCLRRTACVHRHARMYFANRTRKHLFYWPALSQSASIGTARRPRHLILRRAAHVQLFRARQAAAPPSPLLMHQSGGRCWALSSPRPLPPAWLPRASQARLRARMHSLSDEYSN